MRFDRYLLTVTLLSLLVLLAACSTANEGVSAIPERNASGAFAVTALEGQGTYTPSLLVSEQEDAVAVTVNVSGAQDLSGAFVHVSYDTGTYTPKRVELGTMLGEPEDVVSLALTDVAGIVPVGIAQITSSGVAPAVGSGELATVYFAREPFLAPRSVSSCPKGDYNCVEDLSIIAQDATTATLRWTEKNVGDYDNNGLVGVSDLTPVGVNFNAKVSTSSDPEKLSLVDGNHDDYINVSDITAIGQNFGSQITGYRVYKDSEGTNPYNDGLTVLRSDFDADKSHPVVYTFQADLPPGYVGFTVRPGVAAEPNEAGPISNVAEVKEEPGPPAPPTNLTAVSDASTGHQTVKLTWTASTSPDIDDYVVERKMVTDTDWVEIKEVGQSTTCTDQDPTFVEGAEYTYRVYARDFGGEVSTYAELAAPIEVYFVQGPDAPRNVVADNNCGVQDAIDVQWDAPADETGVMRYRVYCKGPGETEFGQVFESLTKLTFHFMHSGLTQGEYYEYYVKSVSGDSVESDPSDTAGNTPCEYVPEIHITDLSTDKTTHCNDASEGVSNITATCDVAPDSVDWSASGGTINGNDLSATWQPTNGMNPSKVTVTCTAHLGTSQDTQTIDLYVTDDAILTQYGNSGMYMTGAPGPDMLEKLIDGGDKITGRQFEYYMHPDKVTWLGTFDTS